MKIAVLVSGGVDSSVALRLLKEAGHELTAFYLKIWLEDELQSLGECPWEDDLAYIRAVCEDANVPLEIVPFQKEYHKRVIAYTIAEVKAGRTPNPDMLCNARIKFGAFYDCVGNAYDKIATGHYAQIEEMDSSKNSLVARIRSSEADTLDILCSSDQKSETVPASNINGVQKSFIEKFVKMKFCLKMSPDHIKDQTYFLSQLSQAQLARAIFPIGHLHKSEVRKLAKKFNLPNALRKDSQGLCFLGKIPFDKFLEHYLDKRPGKLVEYETGKILGEHNGFWYFTVGQRRGIHLSGGPWYVVSKDVETNTVFISNAARDVMELRDTVTVSGFNWISGDVSSKTELSVKVRHGAKMYQAAIEYMKNNRLRVKLAEKDRGLAPGQFAVLYDGEYCLGGGVIE
jgi:tRNA-5-taurinomethyluridine 2-sulfurtransferase